MAVDAGTAKGGMKKVDAVRVAMGKLGMDAGPSQLQKYIKDELHIDMTPNHVSTCKGDILREAGKKPTTAKKPAAHPPAKTVAKSPAKPASATVGGIGLQDIQAVKALVARVGASNLKSLIDLMAK